MNIPMCVKGTPTSRVDNSSSSTPIFFNNTGPNGASPTFWSFSLHFSRLRPGTIDFFMAQISMLFP